MNWNILITKYFSSFIPSLIAVIFILIMFGIGTIATFRPNEDANKESLLCLLEFRFYFSVVGAFFYGLGLLVSYMMIDMWISLLT